jgi:hypothetical protein
VTSISVVTVTDRELDPHLERATREVRSFPFRSPDGARDAEEGEGATLRGRRISYRPLKSAEPPKPAAREFSLSGRINEISPRDELFTDVEHSVLRVLRRAVQVYLQIYGYYEEASGLDRLKTENRDGRLSERSEPELLEKIEAASAASLFALCGFTLAALRSAARDVADDGAIDLPAPDAFPLGSQTEALHACLHHFHAAIDAHARDDASLVRAVTQAARQQAARLAAMAGSLQHLEFFTRYHYRIEPEDVLVAGFELPDEHLRSDIEVQRKRPEDVVGNHVAKLEASRIAQRLVCYDTERQANPFVDLGGFVFSFIGDGSPGTGKTTLIQMVVTLLQDYSEVAGLPLRYQNFSVDEISDYQGRSGQNAKRFCRAIMDPRVVGFGTVDDVDQVCGNRNDRNASAGQLEVTGVLMQELGGANTVIRGNASFGLFSNYPEKVDAALRQRTQARFQVDGPETHEDFTDLLHLLLSGSCDLPLGGGYEPLATQQIRRVIEQKYGEHATPSSAALREVLGETLSRTAAGALSSWRDFGGYLYALKRNDPRFTGRAVKNIADAIQSRMMDFDLPAEWLEKRTVFFDQPYEARVAMIAELRSEITPEIVLQEINRYSDSEARYSEAADERELEERTRQIELDARARQAAAQNER